MKNKSEELMNFIDTDNQLVILVSVVDFLLLEMNRKENVKAHVFFFPKMKTCSLKMSTRVCNILTKL